MAKESGTHGSPCSTGTRRVHAVQVATPQRAAAGVQCGPPSRVTPRQTPPMHCSAPTEIAAAMPATAPSGLAG